MAEVTAVVRATDDVPSADPLAELFWRHRMFGDWDDDDTTCGCGATPPDDAREEAFGSDRWHDGHLATAAMDWFAARLADPAVVEAVALAIHRERHQGIPCMGPSCWDRDKADEHATAALAATTTALTAATEETATERFTARRSEPLGIWQHGEENA